MANLNLVGAVDCKINGALMVTITRAQIRGTRPVTVKYGARGAIGSAKGAEKVSVSLTFAVPVAGLEADILGALNAPGGFTFEFPVGAERHAIIGCQRSDRSFSIDQEAGNSEFTMDITGTDWIRTA